MTKSDLKLGQWYFVGGIFDCFWIPLTPSLLWNICKIYTKFIRNLLTLLL